LIFVHGSALQQVLAISTHWINVLHVLKMFGNKKPVPVRDSPVGLPVYMKISKRLQ